MIKTTLKTLVKKNSLINSLTHCINEDLTLTKIHFTTKNPFDFSSRLKNISNPIIMLIHSDMRGINTINSYDSLSYGLAT